jgi:hypothetical protein
MSSSSKPSLEANSNRFCDWTQHKDRITHSIEDDGEKIKDLPKLTKAYGFDARYVVSTRSEATRGGMTNIAQYKPI